MNTPKAKFAVKMTLTVVVVVMVLFAGKAWQNKKRVTPCEVEIVDVEIKTYINTAGGCDPKLNTPRTSMSVYPVVYEDDSYLKLPRYDVSTK